MEICRARMKMGNDRRLSKKSNGWHLCTCKEIIVCTICYVMRLTRSCSLMSPWCRVYASANRVTIGSENGLSPVRRQAIILTNAELSLNGPLGTDISGILIKIS